MEAEGPRRTARVAAVAIAGAVLGVSVFLSVSNATLRLGFPLDDAWIHQTYARNLAARGEWAFIPGARSGGSTSPLWTLFLAVGHWLRLDPRGWAYALGAGLLAASAVLASVWFGRRTGNHGSWLFVIVATFVLEWHLVWSAASGMEIVLFLTLALAIMLLSHPPVARPGAIGLLVGLGVWIRPDAITLAVIPATSILLAPGTSPARWTALGRLAAGAAASFLPYLLFNLLTAGTPWPSTLYAKQAEYAVLRAGPFLPRLLRLAADPRTGGPLTGPALLLFPGLVLAAVVAVRRRQWPLLAPVVWAALYLGIYAARLPVTYQHGRYQIPVLPVILVMGWEGFYLAMNGAKAPLVRTAARAWAASAVAVTLAFVALGAQAYGRDVALIESEMVDAARWVSRNTESGALIAAHDIGALGYFGGREVLDLAGLTQAEVIPVLRDEKALADLLHRRGADYLMTFPAWYPSLTACAVAIYTSDGPYSPALGGENMRVYRWPSPPVVAPEGCMLYSPWSPGNAVAHERDLSSDR